MHGKVYAADAKDDVRQDFVVKGDRFVAVGSDAEAFVGPRSKVLTGRSVCLP